MIRARTGCVGRLAFLFGGASSALSAWGCAPRHTLLASGLEKAYAFECAPDRIRVLSQRKLANDELWALTACGARIELERGLEFPSSASQQRELSEGEIAEIRENLKPGPSRPEAGSISFAPLDSARERARELCVLGPAPDRFAVANATIEQQAACQQRLWQSTEPLGVERDEQGVTRYWFRVGSYAFPTFVSYHAPACSRLTLNDTLEYCECERAAGRRANCDAERAERKRVLLASRESAGSEDAAVASEIDGDAPTTGSDAQRAAESGGVKWYTRGGIGLGRLASGGKDADDIETLTLDWNAWGGALLHPRFAVGFGISWHQGLSENSVTYDNGTLRGQATWTPDAFGIGSFVSGMPFPIPLRFDLEGGLGLLIRASAHASDGRSRTSGLYLATGLGWEIQSEYLDVGFTGKFFLLNTSDHAESFHTTGIGVVLNVGTHARRRVR
jgi:hypothetical protein